MDEAANRCGSLAIHHEGTKATKDPIAPSNITFFVPFASFLLFLFLLFGQRSPNIGPIVCNHVAKGALTDLIKRGVFEPFGVERLRA